MDKGSWKESLDHKYAESAIKRAIMPKGKISRGGASRLQKTNDNYCREDVSHNGERGEYKSRSADPNDFNYYDLGNLMYLVLPKFVKADQVKEVINYLSRYGPQQLKLVKYGDLFVPSYLSDADKEKLMNYWFD